MKNKNSISLCMIVRNEEANLPRCLESVKNVVDEIIIVDTGSVDRTKDIAQTHGARILDFKWTNNFSAARNQALDCVNTGWIMHLDADECLHAETSAILKQIVNRTSADALTINVRNYQSASDMVKYIDDPQVRLFRADRGYRYEQAVHEQISHSILREDGKMESTDLVIEHFGYMDDPADKAERNLPIMEDALKNDPDSPYLNFKMGETLKALNRLDDAKHYLLNVFNQNYKSLPPVLLDTLMLRIYLCFFVCGLYQLPGY